jgi:outer membrane protein TolC
VQLLSAQAEVIAQTNKALAQYNAAYAALEEGRRSKAQVEAQSRTAHESLKSGETDQLAAVSAELQAAVAERARLDALHQAQLTLGTLEDALQRPIDPASAPALPKKAPR